jgi:uncharacterized membrane protein YsdA (DUF1294 family)/cold shock CspA family protein
MRFRGRITEWKDDKGFGFITPDRGGPTLFVHISAFSHRTSRPVGNERVTYEVALDKQNRPQAIKVSYPNAGTTEKAEAPDIRIDPKIFVAPVLLFSFIGYCVFSGRLHPSLLLSYIVLSCLTYMLYAFDKAAALQRQWRTQENTLHVLSVLGGWPGAMVAQSMFRHKTKKTIFRAGYWVTVAINCLGLAAILNPAAALTLLRMVAGK